MVGLLPFLSDGELDDEVESEKLDPDSELLDGEPDTTSLDPDTFNFVW